MRDHLGNFVLNSNLKFAKGIMLLDDCEGTCNWTITGLDANVAGSFETDAAFTGLKGLKLVTGNADPGAGDWAYATKNLSYPESGLLVCRSKIGIPDFSLIEYIGWFLTINDGVYTHTASFQYAPNTPKTYYTGPAGTLVEITEMALSVVDTQWIIMELVLDLLSHQYISASFNGIKKSLSGISYYEGAANTDRYVAIKLKTSAAGAASATGFFDNIYVGEFVNI